MEKGDYMLNELMNQIHNDAKEKGWWETPNSDLECHMLIVSEVAEATEAVRNREPDFYVKDGKPEGHSVELADALIRILDFAGYKGWDMDFIVKLKLDYNKTRSYRHGNKAH